MTLPPLDPVLERFVAFLRVTRSREHAAHATVYPSARQVCTENTLEVCRKVHLIRDSRRERFSTAFLPPPFSFFNHFQLQSFSFFISISYLPFHGYRRRDFYEPVNRWQFSTTDNGGEREEEGRAPFRSSKLARGVRLPYVRP